MEVCYGGGGEGVLWRCAMEEGERVYYGGVLWRRGRGCAMEVCYGGGGEGVLWRCAMEEGERVCYGGVLWRCAMEEGEGVCYKGGEGVWQLRSP